MQSKYVKWHKILDELLILQNYYEPHQPCVNSSFYLFLDVVVQFIVRFECSLPRLWVMSLLNALMAMQ